MATNITRWSPDTCGCVIEYSWDSDVSEDERVHTFHKVVEQCPDHNGIEVHEEIHNHVLAENQTKNKVEVALFDNFPRLRQNFVDAAGTTQKRLDPTVKHNWRFIGKDKDRQLISSFDNLSLSATEKSRITKALGTLDKPVVLE